MAHHATRFVPFISAIKDFENSAIIAYLNLELDTGSVVGFRYVTTDPESEHHLVTRLRGIKYKRIRSPVFAFCETFNFNCVI
jgi:hypothetical protein